MYSCYSCYCCSDTRKFYSKLIGSLNEDANYYCNECYHKVQDDEEKLIEYFVKSGSNIASIIKQDYVIDYVNPTSSSAIIKPMNIHKIVSENINGIKTDFVMIELEEYNHYMSLVAISNKKLINEEMLKKQKQKQEKQEEVERRKIQDINEKEKRYQEKQRKIDEKIELEAKINRHNNDKIKKEKEELMEQFKEVFNNDKTAKISKCNFCKEFKVFPYHFKDENNNFYKKSYTQDKRQEKAVCCISCFEKEEQKKEDRILENTHYCEICKSSYIAFTNDMVVCHLKSTKHKRNENKLKGKTDLSLLTAKELMKICSKTLDEKGMYRINNYTKPKKMNW